VLQLRAGGQDVRPGVRAARERGTRWSRVRTHAAAALLRAPARRTGSRVIVASKQEPVLVTWRRKRRGDVDEADQPDDSRRGTAIRSEWDPACLRLDDLGLAINDQAQRPAHGHHREGLKRGIWRLGSACDMPNTGQQVAARERLRTLLRVKRPAELFQFCDSTEAREAPSSRRTAFDALLQGSRMGRAEINRRMIPVATSDPG